MNENMIIQMPKPETESRPLFVNHLISLTEALGRLDYWIKNIDNPRALPALRSIVSVLKRDKGNYAE